MPESPVRPGSRDGEQPALSVIVTHYKSVPALRRSLASLATALDPATSEVVVVDAEAQPGTDAAVTEELAWARYLPFADDVGFAVSANAGLEGTSADLVLVLNADVEVTRETVAELRAALDADPTLGLVAPRLRNDDGSVQDSAFRFYRPQTVLHRRTATGHTPWGRRGLDWFEAPSRELETATEPVRTDWVLGAVMMLRREAVAATGPFDTRYFMYFEDVDMCLRLWKAGWAVAVVPTAVASHSHGKASRGKGPRVLLRNKWARVHVRSALKFFARHGVRPRRPHELPRPSAPAGR